MACLSAAVFCFPSGTKAAITYLSNLPDTSASSDTAGLTVLGPVVGGQRIAVGFDIVTPADGTWNFTIRVNNPPTIAHPTAPGSQVGLQLVNDSTVGAIFDGHQPGVQGSLFSITQTAVSSGFSVTGNHFDYTFSGSGLLSAGKYWLIGTSTDSEGWDWRSGTASYDVNGGAANDATIYGYRGSDSGGTWNSQSLTTPLGLTIDVTPVPEPAQTGVIAAIFLVACSLTHLIRRRSRSASLASPRS